MIRLTTRGPVIVKDDEWVAQQRQFAERHCVVFEDFVDGSILERVPRMLETSRYFTFDHPAGDGRGLIARELCMEGSEPLVGMFFLLLNQPRLFEAITELTGSETPIRGFDGRCYKMVPGGGHFDSWHSDVSERENLYGLSINLSHRPFVGGSFQIRNLETGEILRTVETRFGDACLFRIHPALSHRVRAVRGTLPKCSYAGWFTGKPHYREVYRKSARPCED